MASIMDLISSLFKREDGGDVVPIDPLTYNIMHQPVSYANDDGEMTPQIASSHASGDRGLALLNKYPIDPLDTAMLNQFGNKGGISNPMPEPVEGVDTDLRLAQGFDFRNRAAQKFFPKRYPRRVEE